MPADEALGLLSGFVLEAQSVVCPAVALLGDCGWWSGGGRPGSARAGGPQGLRASAFPSLTKQCSSGSVVLLQPMTLLSSLLASFSGRPGPLGTFVALPAQRKMVPLVQGLG